MKTLIDRFEKNPKQLFLVDGFGAVFSAILLGLVLVRFEEVFGIPSTTLYFLAVWPILFAIYDFSFSQKKVAELSPFLKGIAVMNMLYCVLSIACSFYHIETITALGWAYILGEVLIVIMLATIEFGVAKRLIGSNSLV